VSAPLFRGRWLVAAATACAAAMSATAAAAAGQATAAASAPGRAAMHLHTVTIAGMRFSPATLQVRRGERIEWVNNDLVPHTVTARGGSFDSGSIAAGASWTWIATRPGNVDYACAYHPDMAASVTIQ
jgi:plastocyanin